MILTHGHSQNYKNKLKKMPDFSFNIDNNKA